MDKRRIDLCCYRLEKGEQCLRSAKMLIGVQDFASAANRSYYAIFHALRAVLALDGVDFSKHSGVIAYFQRTYIKTGIFEKVNSKIIDSAFKVRTEADYDDYFVLSKEDVSKQIRDAELFLKTVKEYTGKRCLE